MRVRACLCVTLEGSTSALVLSLCLASTRPSPGERRVTKQETEQRLRKIPQSFRHRLHGKITRKTPSPPVLSSYHAHTLNQQCDLPVFIPPFSTPPPFIELFPPPLCRTTHVDNKNTLSNVYLVSFL